MRWARQMASRMVDRQVDPTGLAVFRIFYASVLLCEVCQLFLFRRLVFDPVPFLQPAPGWITVVLTVWIAAVVSLGVGWQTRIACVVNYACSLVILPGFTEYEYHADMMYIPVNLLLIFTPVAERFSVDAMCRKRVPLNTVSRVYAEGLLIVGIAMIYADSVLYKLNSPMWTSGLGVWMPASMPQVASIDASWLLNSKLIVLGLGYAALLHEILFPFLFWQRHARIVLLCSGVGLHAGIAVMFPIPWFALGALSLYVLMIPEDWFVRRTKPNRIATTDTNSRLPYVVIVLVLTCVLSQVPVSLQSPVVDRVAETLEIDDQLDLACIYANRTARLRTRLLGTYPHPVFMDSHFAGYEDSLAILYVDPDGQERWLPIVDQQGHPCGLNTGRQWVRWSWRLNGPRPQPDKVARGIREFTAYWAHTEGVGLERAEFKILHRQLRSPRGWERDFLRQERSKPWTCIGRVVWSHQDFEFQLHSPPWEPAADSQTVAALPLNRPR